MATMGREVSHAWRLTRGSRNVGPVEGRSLKGGMASRQWRDKSACVGLLKCKEALNLRMSLPRSGMGL
jgi:hypothetical protein